MGMSLRTFAAVSVASLSLGLAACAGQETPPRDITAEPPSAVDTAAEQTPGAPVAARVKLEVEIPKAHFLKDTDVTVTVWNARELALRERSGSCTVSMDRSGTETTTCPPGVTYTKPAPETFKVAYSELGSKVVLDVTSLAIGERYEVSIGGAASDGCNHTGAGSHGVAEEKIEIGELSYASTEMACIDR